MIYNTRLTFIYTKRESKARLESTRVTQEHEERVENTTSCNYADRLSIGQLIHTFCKNFFKSFGSEIRCPRDPKWAYKRGRVMEIKSVSFLRLIVSSCIAELDLLKLLCLTLMFFPLFRSPRLDSKD